MEERLGAIAGLAAAASWAIASVWYVRVPLGAGAITTCKNTLATVCMFFVLLVAYFFFDQPLFTVSASAFRDIAISGVIGLGFADIAYFRSIQILGPRRGLTLTLLTTPATTLLGQVWLGDRLTVLVWGWIAMTLFGIAVVMLQRSEKNRDQEIRPGSMHWGVICALFGIANMAVGSVLLKQGVQDVPPLEATFIRLLAASVFGVVSSFWGSQIAELKEMRGNRIAMRDLCLASLVGTVFGVCLMLIAFKYCRIGVAATLTSTSPLFVIPVVYFAYREKIGPIAIGGAVIAFLGVFGLLMNISK